MPRTDTYQNWKCDCCLKINTIHSYDISSNDFPYGWTKVKLEVDERATEYHICPRCLVHVQNRRDNGYRKKPTLKFWKWFGTKQGEKKCIT
jgi:hypothetical protein